ncbi:MAG: NAD(P)H-dependent oxidoreductase [Campylobacteraceae bacterium]|nr:NAD(P)H-dependent oxidoreductase [Campylobacteraceae bacterium]
MYTILVASLNENMVLANKLQAQLKDLGKESVIINLVELNLPLYDSLKEEKNGIPSPISTLMNTMEKSDGYIVVSPEYNWSIPPVLSNTLAWISRADDDFRILFNEKMILLATHSGGDGSILMQAMRAQFVKLGSIVLSREIMTTYEKKLNEKSSSKILGQLIKFSQQSTQTVQ